MWGGEAGGWMEKNLLKRLTLMRLLLWEQLFKVEF